jgi:hypothetical protein
MVTRKGLSPSQQLAILKHEFPKSTGNVHLGKMVWRGNFQPSPLSDMYKLKIVLEQDKKPKAYIDYPKPLQLAEGAKTLPHTYRSSKGVQQLCLFLPSAGEWNSSMQIATTIVHWAVQWMFYYELWVVTGKWLGGGHGNWDTEITESADTSSHYNKVDQLPN